MKILITLFLFILSFHSFAIDREIVILTSIKTPKKQPFWRSNSYQISKDAEEQFRNRFKDSGYTLVFKHQADRETLEHHLQSPKTIALFWLSHAAGQRNYQGLSFASTIQDYYGNNVKNIFQKVNPNIMFLGLIGCNALPILNKFRKQGYYHESLKFHSYDKTISLNKGIRKSIEASSSILDSNPREYGKIQHFETSCIKKRRKSTCRRTKIKGRSELFTLQDIIMSPRKDGIEIQIINTNPEYSAEITTRAKFIGVLKRGETIQNFTIPYSYFKDNKFKLTINYDNSILENDKTISSLEIFSDKEDLTMRALKDKYGNLWGLNKNFYNINY